MSISIHERQVQPIFHVLAHSHAIILNGLTTPECNRIVISLSCLLQALLYVGLPLRLLTPHAVQTASSSLPF